MAGEFSPVPPESAKDDDEETTSKSRKKRKAGEGLFNLAQYLDPESQKESAEADGEKDNPFERAWKWFFKKIASVENQDSADEAGSQAEAFPDLEWQPEEAQTLQEFDTAPLEAVDQPAQIPAYELLPSEPEMTDEQEAWPEAAPADTEPPEPPSPEELASLAVTAPEAEPEDIPQAEFEEAVTPETYELPQDMVSPQLANERAQTAEQQPQLTTPETVAVNQGNALLPAFVVDQLARRRDRKQKRAIERSKRRIEELEKQAKTTQERIEPRVMQSERAAEVAKQQIEAVKRQVRAEQQPERVEYVQLTQERQPEIRNQAAPQPKNPEYTQEIQDKPPELPPPLPEISPELAPIVVLQEVETAAEKNAPLEAAYELRSEVKDESLASQVQGATSVGAVLADIHKTTTTQHAAFSQALQAAPTEDKQSVVSSGGLYKKAAVSGFWTGLVIVAILIVITIVR